MLTELHGTQPLDLYPIKSGGTVTENAIVVIDAAGDVVDATDAAGVKVIGIAINVDSTAATVEVRDGIVLIANSATNPLARKDRGATAYIEDANTVSAVTGINSVVAGLVVDVNDDGVFVDMRLAALAAA